jgi:hypothetical protein
MKKLLLAALCLLVAPALARSEADQRLSESSVAVGIAGTYGRGVPVSHRQRNAWHWGLFPHVYPPHVQLWDCS